MSKKRLIYIVGLIVLSLSLFLIILFAGRIGKEKIVINYAPSNAQLSIDNKKVSGNTHHLSSGTYTIKVSLDNFETKEVSLDTNNEKELNIILLPANQKGQAIAKNDPSYSKEVEALASKAFSQESKRQTDLYPFKTKLPIERGALFTVGYGAISENNKNINPYAMALYVESSSAFSRYSAMKEIANQLGINLSEIEIIFNDLENPFK